MAMASPVAMVSPVAGDGFGVSVAGEEDVSVLGVQGERLSLTGELEGEGGVDALQDPTDLIIGLLTGMGDVDSGGLAHPLPAPTPLALHEALALPGLASARTQTQIDNLESLRRRLTDTSIPSFLEHLPALLVEYYFDYVCAMWSSFDSDLNPFRTNIARLWRQNAPIYYAIQSMAAASLAGDFPGMRAVGAQMQRRAIHALQEAMALALNDENLFYGLLMVGSTTAWHNGGDLGLPYLQAARRFLVGQSRSYEEHSSWKSPSSSSNSEGLTQQYPFFKQCLLYWNMLAVFVAQDISDVGVADSGSDPHHLPIYVVNGQTLLHPWTGPLPTALQYFYQIARLVRSARHAPLMNMATSRITQQTSPHLPYATTIHPTHYAKAQTLETELLTFDVDGIGHHLPTGDTNTPANHFTILADAYRCVALLQIYHAFPAILVSRLQTQQHRDHNHDHLETDTSATVLPLPLPFLSSPTSAIPLTPRRFRRHLALHIIALLETLPVTSGTRVMQPVLLAATAGSLVFSRGTPLGVAADVWAPFDAVDVEIAQARRRVSARLADLTRILPRPPLERVGDLVREVWRRADDAGAAGAGAGGEGRGKRRERRRFGWML